METVLETASVIPSELWDASYSIPQTYIHQGSLGSREPFTLGITFLPSPHPAVIHLRGVGKEITFKDREKSC